MKWGVFMEVGLGLTGASAAGSLILWGLMSLLKVGFLSQIFKWCFIITVIAFVIMLIIYFVSYIHDGY